MNLILSSNFCSTAQKCEHCFWQNSQGLKTSLANTARCNSFTVITLSDYIGPKKIIKKSSKNHRYRTNNGLRKNLFIYVNRIDTCIDFFFIIIGSEGQIDALPWIAEGYTVTTVPIYSIQIGFESKQTSNANTDRNIL